MDQPRFYVRIKGSDFGPVERQELALWASEGRFSPDDQVWYHRLGHWDWVAAGHIAEFQDLFTDLVQEHTEVTQALAEAQRIKKEDEAAGRTSTRLLAVGGGKGGTGKTCFSTAVAISLASLDRSVVLVDCDLGGANVHTSLGMVESEVNLSHFFIKSGMELTDVLLPTPIKGLKLVSGADGVLGLANPKYSQKLKFINRLRKLQADYVVLDLGAGTAYDVLDLFIAADLGIVVSCPDPFSLQNGFNFLKTCTYRRLTREFGRDDEVEAMLESARTEGYKQPLPRMLESGRLSMNGAADRVRQVLKEFRPGLVLNMVMKHSEAREGLVIKSAAAELLGIEVEYLGHVYFDRSVRAALRKMQPFVVADPKCQAASCVLDIVVRKLLHAGRLSGFWQKRLMRKRLRKAVPPVESIDAANEAAIYDGSLPKRRT